MVVKHTQDEYFIRASDTVHINPSIREGERGTSAITGPEVAVQLDRIVPYNIRLPWISGDYAIPSVLTCEPGVWGGSPKPRFTYQWQANGVDLVGETKKTLTTVLDFDKNIMTCKVTGFSVVGSAITVSSGVTVEVTEPIVNEDNYQAVITGLNQLGQQNAMRFEHDVVSGMWVETRSDAMQKLELVATGMWVEQRVDMESATVLPVTGLQIEKTSMVYQDDLYAVAPFTKVGDLPLINAKNPASMAGWTTTTDATVKRKALIVSAPINTAADRHTTPSGSVFSNQANSGSVYDFADHGEASQIVDVPVDLLTQLDAGEIFYDVGLWLTQIYWVYGTHIISEFLAADGVTVLGTHTDSFIAYAYGWTSARSPQKVQVPANTRKIKYTLRIDQNSGASNTKHNQADDLQAAFWING